MKIDSEDRKTTDDKSKVSRQVNVAGDEIDSRELFQTARELRIRHGSDIYRLRLTGLNKLILTK